MIGVDRTSGQVISDKDYLKDRIQSCLTMRIGTHPMRRLKGSRLPELIDRPLNITTLFEIQVATLDALNSEQNGFTDLTVQKVTVDSVEPGKTSLTIIFKQNGLTDTLQGIEIAR
jgi:phage baseplate assembly protein W